MKPLLARSLRNMQRYTLAGLITIGPLFVTWLVFDFVLSNLARAGMPLVQLLDAVFPEAWLHQAWMQSLLAVVLMLVGLFFSAALPRWSSGSRLSRCSNLSWSDCRSWPRSTLRCANFWTP